MKREVDTRLRIIQFVLAAFALGATIHLFYYSLSSEGGLTLFAQQFLNALTMGGIYALIAVGYTMVYGIIQLINFAHGEIYMMGAFLGITFIGMGVPFIPSMILAMACCAVLGIAIDQVAYRPLRRAPRLAALITAIGMSLFLQNLAMMIWGASVYPFPDLKPEFSITVTGPTWTAEQLDESTIKPFDEYFTKIKARELEGIPFLKNYDMALANLKSAEAENDTENIKQLQKRFKEADKAIPRVKKMTISGIEETENGAVTTMLIKFRIGTKETDAFSVLNDWRNWARNQRPEGISRSKRAQISFEKSVHIFQKDAIALVTGKEREGGVQITVKTIFILASSLLLMVFLNGIVQYTRVGKAMRACAQDKTTASLMGVNVNGIIVMTFVLGSSMAAVAGILYGLYLGSGIYFRMGYFAGVLAFAAAVLGGIGNLKGAMLGGLLLGFVQGISKAYITDWMTEWVHKVGNLLGVGELWKAYNINASYDYALAFTILILVILIRPTGLLGKPPADRA